MSPADLAAVVILNLVGAAAPGPDVILMTRTATRSRSLAYATVLGILVGVTTWTTLTVAGAAAVLTAFPGILRGIQFFGGAFLVFMGYGLLRSSQVSRRYPPKDVAELERSVGTPRRAFVRGMATNFSNPKIVIFLSALIAPVLPPEPSLSTATLVIAAMVLSTLVFFLIMTTVISTNKVRTRLLRASWMIDLLAGIFFSIAGVFLVLRGAFGLF